ncbi:MAG TPA: hypothetical protein PKL78_12335 [Anaerolineales bacterium]|nr:hypothetical protein [Anaerolineales bacterium]HNN14342.1 hypothetical protein [Anaerolineales bacterium]HNO30462.1 hypothetical protein [Anaerolineales bacterium]
MAKKNKRPTPVVSVANTSAAQKTEFNPDYTQVKKDLTRIGVLAGSILVALVALSFFLK